MTELLETHPAEILPEDLKLDLQELKDISSDLYDSFCLNFPKGFNIKILSSVYDFPDSDLPNDFNFICSQMPVSDFYEELGALGRSSVRATIFIAFENKDGNILVSAYYLPNKD